MEKLYLSLFIIVIFLIGFFYLGYQYVQNQRYESWRLCYADYLYKPYNPDNATMNLDICNAMLTHKPGKSVNPF